MTRTNEERKESGLTVEALAAAKRLPAEFLHKLGLSNLSEGGVGIPYHDMIGCRIAAKKRTALKATDGTYWPKGKPLAAYGQERLDVAAKAGFLILVEGESDCWAMWHHGLPALGIPGANVVKTLEKEHVEAVETIYVHREPDNGGELFVEGIRKRLAALGWPGKLIELRMPDGIKDPADLHVADPEQFKARLEEAISSSTPRDLQHRPELNGRDTGDRTKPKKTVRTLEPYRPFPVDALPSLIAEYVRQAAAALGCDPAYVALPCIAVAAGLIGFTRVLRLKRTWRAPSVLWTMVVADSGSLKTPGFRHATDFLFTLQKYLDAEYKRKLAQYCEEKEKWVAAVKAAKEGKGDPPGDEPEPPIRRTVFTSDATIEAIAELIGENPRGLVVSCDELASWLNSFSRYKGKAGGTDLPRWLSMHSAGGFAYHRKTGDRRRIVVPHAAVSIAGGIQPDILARAIAGDFVDSGGWARILPAMPPRPAKVWSEMEIDPDTEKRYHKLLESLHGLEFDGDEPHVLLLSREAKAAWVRWYNEWGREQATAEGELAAAFSKLEEAAARFALVHHVVMQIDRNVSDLGLVEVESMEAGIALARWFGVEARRVYAALAEDEGQRATRKLVEYIRARGGHITARGLQRSNSRKYPTAEAAEAALEQLATDELGSWEPPMTTAKGGQPARRFRLHPTLDSTDATRDTQEDAERGPPDTTTNSDPPSPDFCGENQRCVGSVMRRTGSHEAESKSEEDDASSLAPEVVSDGDRQVTDL
jgi:hypothetical protein